MELRNINTFLHIAELHSFSRTARHLGYSQSAVSSQIAQLEAELGAPLFDRVGKTVRLTDAGQTFLGYARTLLATAQQAQAALQPAKQISGSLRIALADSVCSTFLPGLLKRYHALCPQVELVLCTATADGMLQMLGTNQIDPHAASLSGQRQLAAATRAREAVAGALEAAAGGFGLDAVSVCVDDALDALCDLTGENASEAVINEVFERFCVGK